MLGRIKRMSCGIKKKKGTEEKSTREEGKIYSDKLFWETSSRKSTGVMEGQGKIRTTG